MISNYVQQFIDTIPKKKECESIDIVLDGGLFNGSYLAGAMHFLKALEKRGCTKVMRISGCSVGSFAAVLYHVNSLDLSEKIYEIMLNAFKTKYILNVFSEVFSLIKPRFSKKLIQQMNGRVFITYYNVQSGKHVVKSHYKDLKDIFRTIKKSCFVPFLVNGNMTYMEKYIDGINPYIFPIRENRRILYMNLLGYDKVTHIISVKNEKTNFHRMLAGMLDIHLFYTRKMSSQMCSWVNDWNILERFYFYLLRYVVERILYYSLYVCFVMKKIIPCEIYDTVFYYYASRTIKNYYVYLIQTYCV